MTNTAFPDLRGKQWAKAVPPVPHGLMADIDAALTQEIFDLSQRQGVADIRHDCEADDLRRTVEITKGIVHHQRLRGRTSRLKPIYSDNAATTAVDLIPVIDGDISRVTADAAYDTIAVYEAAGARGAQVVVPPKRTAAVSRRRPRSFARDRTVKRVQEIGRRRWKKETGYHRQARVENVFFRYKSIIGEGFRARSSAGQGAEAVLACNVLNRMRDLGRPASYAIRR